MPAEAATAPSSPHTSSQFASSRWPPSVSTDSGWNCTPCRGSSRCCNPMITPGRSVDAVRAVTSSSSGTVSSTTAREWYRVAVKGVPSPASTPVPSWLTSLVLPCMSSAAWVTVAPKASASAWCPRHTPSIGVLDSAQSRITSRL
ncbi:hypothetical protein N869_16550 [Cellulomonas bogoriensis 69B4 = DSM 16987]|uniref:Uncharacterized protein n=1 Tax=Cellulomonas bogoriensis 69B4 = DSM 16987 TaxID=1386082 RepID=A0A0A0C0R2_9CELL|nr:hypothetical protein N869_16550 [Cellulomonas bogoriensis 69B4 = DSM 16987]